MVLSVAVQATDISVYQQKINEVTLESRYKGRDAINEITAISDSGRHIDLSVKETDMYILIPTGQIKKWMNTMRPDGSWGDIDYHDQGRSSWHPSNHVLRLYHFTKSYYSDESPLNHSSDLMKCILSGLEYWFRTEPVCPNWWFNEIGINKAFGPMILLLDHDLTEEQRSKAVKQLSRSAFGRTGQNKVWLAGNVAYKAILQKDMALLKQAHDTIISEIFITTAEGIQPDFSYHQHGPQLQFGNYGLAYASSMSYWLNIFNGTDLAFPEKDIKILQSYFLKGLNQVIWKGYMDLSACGRQLFKGAQRGKALAFESVLADMKDVSQSSSLDNQVSSRYYYRSDFLSHKGNDWYVSVKMSSPRVIGTESGNGENLKGYYLADGVTSIMRKGDEYENIYPLWDWRKLPGATIPQSNEPLPQLTWDGYRNQSDFVGGVSDGKMSVAAFYLQRDGVSAKKAYFVFPDQMICLGTEIQTKRRQRLLTTVNQAWKRGDIVLYQSGREWLSPDHSRMSLNAPVTIYHAGLVYHIHQAGNVNVSSKNRQGNWHEIATFYDTTTIEKPVFTLDLQDQSGSYAYSVSPADTKEKAKEMMNNISYSILRNDKDCQAVTCEDAIQAVFYSSGSLNLSKDVILKVNTSGTYICIPSKTGWQLIVSDPTQQLEQVSFSLSGRYKEGTYNQSDKTTSFSFKLPAKEKAGDSLKIFCKRR